MKNPSPTNDAPLSRLEVRVLHGEQPIACSLVDVSTSVTLGAGWDKTVVLRHAGLDDCRILLDAGTDGGVRLSVLQGTPRVDGQVLATGDHIEQPLYVPLELGTASIAFGEPGSTAWDVSPPASDPELTSTAPMLPAPPRWARWAAGVAALLVVSSVTVLGYSHAMSSPLATSTEARVPEQEARLLATLVAAGFEDTSVSADSNGKFHVSGHVDTVKQRERLERLLSHQGLPFQIDVWVNESLATAVLDVLRVNDVRAEVEVSGAGRARVTTHQADTARLQSMRSVILRDVPGVSELAMDHTPGSEPSRPLVPVEDPGKRIAAVVPGDPSYVVTTDGTRYFEGALLPTGQRIAVIREKEVQLDFAGTTTTLRF